jgi:hypothetical protein
MNHFEISPVLVADLTAPPKKSVVAKKVSRQ